MKKNTKRALLFALTVATLLSLFACSRADIVVDGNKLKDKRTKITYAPISLSYEPIEMKDEVYGKTDIYEFHEIVEQDPQKLICEVDGTVFAAKGTTVPTPDAMSFDYLEICTDDTNFVVNKTLTDSNSIKAIMLEHLNADTIKYTGITATTAYKLRFADTSLGLYYSVQFLRYEEDLVLPNENGEEINYGKDFIYDRFEGRFTKAPDALVAVIDG